MNTVVLEETEDGDVPMDVCQRLAENRILFITNYINDEIATDIVASLLLKDSEDSSKITLFINSNGGDIRNVFMIYDVMKIINSPIETVCLGEAMNESVLLLSGGTKGMRFATKNSVISVNQLITEYDVNTNLVDAKKLMTQFKSDNDKFLNNLSNNTKKSVKQLREDFDRKVFFTASKALKYGLIDKVIASNK